MTSLKELTNLYDGRAKDRRGIIEFSLHLRQMLLGTEIEENKKREIRLLMSKGAQNERNYLKPLSGKRMGRRRPFAYYPAADYFRCHLAKATSDIMNGLTGRYKNEAARRKFFTNLAAITEAIHISTSDDKIMELFERRESDRLADTVLREVATLVKSSFDPNEEIKQKLVTARREFSEFMSSAENLFDLRWEDSEKYDEDLSLVSFFDPWCSENEQTEKWGTVCYSNPTTLNVNPPVMFFDALRRSVIAREAVNFLTPRIVDSVYRLYEQSEYLVTKLLRDKYEKEFWLFARHGLREETKKEVITGITDFFSYYESFVGDDLYREAWSRLAEMTRLSLQIDSVPEYARMLDTIAARPVRVRLDRKEIALFNVLAERPDMPMSEVARHISTSIPTATKLMQKLTQKACLRFFIHANDRTLGLEEYLLLMRTPKPDRLPPVLWRIPYCRDIYRTYGPMDYFVVVNVPEGNESFIRRLESELEDCDLTSECATLVSTRDLSNMSFEYFDPNESIWHVHWDSWGAGLAKAMKERKSAGRSRSSEYRAERVSFDRLDLQILEKLMYNSRGSYSEIGKALGVSGAYISRKIHRLLRNQVFRPIAKPFKIGAEEYALVTIACEENYVEPLIEFLGKLPAWRGAVVKGSYEGVLAQVGVPSGEVNQLFMVFDDRLVKTRIAQCSFNVVGMWSSLRRWLPVNLYSKHEGWKFEENKYLDIIERYGK